MSLSNYYDYQFGDIVDVDFFPFADAATIKLDPTDTEEIKKKKLANVKKRPQCIIKNFGDTQLMCKISHSNFQSKSVNSITITKKEVDIVPPSIRINDKDLKFSSGISIFDGKISQTVINCESLQTIHLSYVRDYRNKLKPSIASNLKSIMKNVIMKNSNQFDLLDQFIKLNKIADKLKGDRMNIKKELNLLKEQSLNNINEYITLLNASNLKESMFTETTILSISDLVLKEAKEIEEILFWSDYQKGDQNE